jgi:hypothetical protein
METERAKEIYDELTSLDYGYGHLGIFKIEEGNIYERLLFEIEKWMKSDIGAKMEYHHISLLLFLFP